MKLSSHYTHVLVVELNGRLTSKHSEDVDCVIDFLSDVDTREEYKVMYHSQCVGYVVADIFLILR